MGRLGPRRRIVGRRAACWLFLRLRPAQGPPFGILPEQLNELLLLKFECLTDQPVATRSLSSPAASAGRSGVAGADTKLLHFCRQPTSRYRVDRLPPYWNECHETLPHRRHPGRCRAQHASRRSKSRSASASPVSTAVSTSAVTLPRLIYPEPMIIRRRRLPFTASTCACRPGHAKNWRRYCDRYRACGRPGLFRSGRLVPPRIRTALPGTPRSWHDRDYRDGYRDGHRDGDRYDDRGRPGPRRDDRGSRHGQGRGRD